MTIKTFDANRVGGGTFQLEQDSLTGEYKVKEVGFVKLPELKLPEIDQAAYTVPDLTPDDPTGEDPTEPGTGTGGGGSGGGGGGNQQDFTGATQLRNIGKEATGDSANLMNQATTLSSNLSNVDRTSLDQGAIKVEDIRSLESMPKAYQNLVNEYNRHQADVQQRNMTGSADEEQALSDLMYSRELRNQINEMKGTSFVTKEGATITAGRKDSEIIKAAPVISEDLQKFGPITTTGETGVPDMIVQGQPSLPDQNIFSKAKDVVSNTKPVQLMGIGVRAAGKVISGVTDAVLGVTEVDRQRQRNATSFFDNVSSKNYKTRGELGSNTDPGRLAGNPSVDLFAGMNKVSAKGNLEKAGAKRVDTRNNTIERRGIKDKAYADANGLKYDPNGMSADFHRNTKGMEVELNDMRNHNNNENIKSYNKKKDATPINQLNPNEMRNVAETGDSGGDSGGKSIVCTAMYQTTGLQDWSKAMKIWYIYQKRYLSIQHQEGYHKLFKPFVKAMHKSNIVKAIGAHFAKHRTQHLKHVMFNSKPSLLGKIYNKILEPICYWAGRK